MRRHIHVHAQITRALVHLSARWRRKVNKHVTIEEARRRRERRMERERWRIKGRKGREKGERER